MYRLRKHVTTLSLECVFNMSIQVIVQKHGRQDTARRPTHSSQSHVARSVALQRYRYFCSTKPKLRKNEKLPHPDQDYIYKNKITPAWRWPCPLALLGGARARPRRPTSAKRPSEKRHSHSAFQFRVTWDPTWD